MFTISSSALSARQGAPTGLSGCSWIVAEGPSSPG
jgi:hypothetical protein